MRLKFFYFTAYKYLKNILKYNKTKVLIKNFFVSHITTKNK